MNFSAWPKESYLAHKIEIDSAVASVLDSGRYILGPEVARFEKELAESVNRESAVGVASGTDALHLALRACGIGRDDHVVTVSHTSVATVAAIELAGARAILIDVDKGSLTMDPNLLNETLESEGSKRIKAVVPVHLYGHPADLPAISQIASQYALRVIEDCAQAQGAAIANRTVGNWGDAAAFSHYPTKNLGALGDGGSVVADGEIATKARLLRQYGWQDDRSSHYPGLNSRLSEIQAAILRVKLPYLKAENARRRELAEIYTRLLPPEVIRPVCYEGYLHAFHQYVIQVEQRDALREFLATRTIPTNVHYPLPVHLQPAYAGRVQLGKGDMHHTERAARKILSLPLHPHLGNESIELVAATITEWCERCTS